MVFTANAGFVWKNKFIVGNYRHKVRRREAAHFEKWFAARNYQIFHLSGWNRFEGEGDLLLCGDLLFAGSRTCILIISHKKVAEIIEREILSLRLINHWFTI
jgi:N-dimethylarginine dimethylaminohydrolase